MDFGDILNEWDRIKEERSAAKPKAPSPDPTVAKALESWLDKHGVEDKDSREGESGARPERETRRLALMKAQDVLDLHGMKAVEAKAAIAAFIDSASRRGLEKVLVIHGKGLHSEKGAVLKDATRQALEAHRLAGRFGTADKADGGSGAVWVLIKARPAAKP
jgi:DNA-nicking Smr family endonuclease